MYVCHRFSPVSVVSTQACQLPGCGGGTVCVPQEGLSGPGTPRLITAGSAVGMWVCVGGCGVCAHAVGVLIGVVTYVSCAPFTQF